VIRDWNWQPARFEDFASIQRRLPFVKLGVNDIPLRLPSKSKRYSCRNIWKAITVKQPKVDWSRLIWFSCVIPRHAFFLRLAAQGSLSTGDRLLK